MVYKKIADEMGDQKDVNEVRYDVLEAHEAWTPQGLNVGWDEYEDMAHALEAYGLTYEPLPKEEKIK